MISLGIGWLWMAGTLQAEERVKPPLEVVDGKLWREDRPYRGIGVNYFDGFRRLLEFPGKRAAGVREYRAGLDFLAKHEIPFARFAAGGFYPTEWKLYQEDPAAYFKLMDDFVSDAEKRGVGLIPCLFWAHFTVPDLCGEPVSAWGTAESETRKFMRRYTIEMVTRYRHSKAVWAWEFGNEFMQEADLKFRAKSDYWVLPRLGTPAVRTAADYPTSAEIIAAYADFAKTVRTLDPHRPRMTGDATLRSGAWHLARGLGWKSDTAQQWGESLLAANPAGIDTLSAHLYHPRANLQGYTGQGPAGFGLDEQFRQLGELARSAGKVVWLGEFGPGMGEQDLTERRKQVAEMLDLIAKHRIELSAYWVFDSLNPGLGVWNAAEGNDNAFVFEMIREANKRLSADMR
ncbi:MAG: cellulase family glycosylhydrolase [Akkermansiaceae bacterium]